MEDTGYVGVTFFFVLSGFVIAYNYYDRFEKFDVRALSDYAASRLARIYPVYAFVILSVWWMKGCIDPIALYLFALQAWNPDVYVAYKLVDQHGASA